MSVPTNATVSPSLPTVEELLIAVQSNATPTRSIENLFVPTLDTALNERPYKMEADIINARIMDARRVHQIVQKGTPPFAIFYKLSDPEKIDKATTAAFYEVYRKAAKRHNTTYEVVMAEIAVFQNSKSPTEQLMATTMSQRLLSHMKNHHKDENSTVTRDEIEQLFNLAFVKGLVNTAVDSFFTVPNRETAASIGIIYNPKSNQIHNWGVNAVWTAALAARRTPIKILSPLDPQSGKHPTDTRFTPGSSAFALEIAIAMKMGYTIDRNSPDEPRLLPPKKAKLDVTLPTREEQEHLYQLCCIEYAEVIQQFKTIKTPSPASSSSSNSPVAPTAISSPATSLNSAPPISTNTENTSNNNNASVQHSFVEPRTKPLVFSSQAVNLSNLSSSPSSSSSSSKLPDADDVMTALNKMLDKMFESGNQAELQKFERHLLSLAQPPIGQQKTTTIKNDLTTLAEKYLEGSDFSNFKTAIDHWDKYKNLLPTMMGNDEQPQEASRQRGPSL